MAGSRYRHCGGGHHERQRRIDPDARARGIGDLVSAAKNAAGLYWPGTFLRTCVVPLPAGR